MMPSTPVSKKSRKRRDLSEESGLVEKKKQQQQQLRVTWGKKGPSIASNKLPDAFATSTTFIQTPADIDKIVELEEQKQINQLLSPIKKQKTKV